MPAADILLKEPVLWVPGLEGSYPGEESYVELGEARVRMVFCWCPPRAAKVWHWGKSGPGFWLARYPVTQEQWVVVMGSNPSHFNLGGTYPVDSVSWLDAQEFCRQAGLRLPASEEWEHACRAMGVGDFGVGSGAALTSQLANFDGDYPEGSGEDAFPWLDREQTLPVGSFPPNSWGLQDMHGQLWEWCEDLHPNGGRVLRGGKRNFVGWNAASGIRNGYEPGLRLGGLGFRPCSGSISQPASWRTEFHPPVY